MLGPLLEIPTEFGLVFVIQGWIVDPGEDRVKKNAKKNERLMERKLGGCQIYSMFLHSV